MAVTATADELWAARRARRAKTPRTIANIDTTPPASPSRSTVETSCTRPGTNARRGMATAMSASRNASHDAGSRWALSTQLTVATGADAVEQSDSATEAAG